MYVIWDLLNSLLKGYSNWSFTFPLEGGNQLHTQLDRVAD
jgi:hypothetical protein